jgi:hypothetical protein
MKNTLLTILVAFVGFLGATLGLMQMYASSDGIPRPLYGGTEFLATSIFIFSFLYNFDHAASTILKWINILLSSGFAVWGFLLSLICLYASPVENQSFPLASVLFLSSTMIAGSGIFFMARKIRVKQDVAAV